MEFNEQIASILKEHNIDVDAGYLCLLGIYHGLDIDSVVPEEVVRAINLTKIVEKDYSNPNKAVIKWNLPLFKGQEFAFEWVKDWIEGFGKVNPDRKGSHKDSLSRMKLFFTQNPEYRKEDVYNARDLYFLRLSNPKYCMHSHKFIFDGAGAMKKSTLLQYCEEVKKSKTQSNNNLKGTVIR